MKLIDSNEVVRIVREEVKDEDNTLPVSFRAGVDYVLKIMNELSTVDAIPIEWIKQWASINYIEGEYSISVDMIEDWEEENETNR